MSADLFDVPLDRVAQPMSSDGFRIIRMGAFGKLTHGCTWDIHPAFLVELETGQRFLRCACEIYVLA